MIGSAENDCFYSLVYECLTHICQMDFPVIIIWMSPLSILGESEVFFHFYFIFYRNSCKQVEASFL